MSPAPRTSSTHVAAFCEADGRKVRSIDSESLLVRRAMAACEATEENAQLPGACAAPKRVRSAAAQWR